MRGGSLVKQSMQIRLQRKLDEESGKDLVLCEASIGRGIACSVPVLLALKRDVIPKMLRQLFYNLVTMSEHTKDGRIKDWRAPGPQGHC